MNKHWIVTFVLVLALIPFTLDCGGGGGGSSGTSTAGTGDTGQDTGQDPGDNPDGDPPQDQPDQEDRDEAAAEGEQMASEASGAAMMTADTAQAVASGFEKPMRLVTLPTCPSVSRTGTLENGQIVFTGGDCYNAYLNSTFSGTATIDYSFIQATGIINITITYNNWTWTALGSEPWVLVTNGSLVATAQVNPVTQEVTMSITVVNYESTLNGETSLANGTYSALLTPEKLVINGTAEVTWSDQDVSTEDEFNILTFTDVTFDEPGVCYCPTSGTTEWYIDWDDEPVLISMTYEGCGTGTVCFTFEDGIPLCGEEDSVESCLATPVPSEPE